MDQNNTAAVMRTLRHVLIRKGLASLLREKPDASTSNISPNTTPPVQKSKAASNIFDQACILTADAIMSQQLFQDLADGAMVANTELKRLMALFVLTL